MALTEIIERPDVATRFHFDLSLTAKRVALADLNSGTWHKWLLGRLGEKWPHIGFSNFATHARSWIDSNGMLFLRCGRATALFAQEMEPLTVEPHVREVFMFVQNKDPQGAWRKDCLRLY